MRYIVVVACLMAGCWKHGGKVHGREVAANLKSAYTAEMAFFQEKDRYEADIVQVGFAPERGNRYAYFLGPSGAIVDRSGQTEGATEGRTAIGVDTFKFGAKAAIPTYHYTGCPLTTARAGGPPLKPGIDGTTFLLTAAGNLDADPAYDCWSIANVDRLDAKGSTIPAGVPYREHDDRDLGLWDRLFE